MTKPTVDLGRVGIWYGSIDALPTPEAQRAAQVVEELGFGALWVAEAVGRDPFVSAAVLLSFGVFFAMILADAGYALLLVLPLALGWHRLGSSDPGRWLRRVGSLCIGLSLAYGVIIGSYFGLNPAPGSALARVVLIDIGDSASMMTLTIAIGVLHMVYACVRNGQRFGKQARALAPLGWGAAIAGGALYAAAELLSVRVLALPGALLVAAGLLLVVVFTAAGEKPLPRL